VCSSDLYMLHDWNHNNNMNNINNMENNTNMLHEFINNIPLKN
jgi:hypothetical protein